MGATDSQVDSQIESQSFQKICEYKVINFLGQGAFGKVYLVESPLKLKFAAKVMALNKQNIESMKQQAILLLNVKHKNVVEVREFFLFNGEKYFAIIMEYCGGGALTESIGKINESKVEKMMMKISEGLKYLHDKNIIHRDIKPENILVGDDNDPKIADLGLAKLISFSLAKTKLGTPFYMAYEIYFSDKYGKEVDIWALGIVFIELVIGQRIWTLDQGMQVPSKRPNFPSQRILDAIKNQKWKYLILQMCIKDPKKRITIDEVINILVKKQFKAVFKVDNRLNSLKEYKNGSYDGELEGDIRNGYGAFVWKDGRKYTGNWKNDKMEGEGIFNNGDGNRYHGQFVNSMYDGRGILYYSNGDNYQGGWKNNKMEGEGTYNFANGTRYVGKYVDGKYHGKGVLYNQNGDFEEGEWRNNQKNGFFVSMKNGKRMKIHYEMNKILSSQLI